MNLKWEKERNKSELLQVKEHKNKNKNSPIVLLNSNLFLVIQVDR